MPSGSAVLIFAPASSRIGTHSTQPSRAANSSGVRPPRGSHFSRGSAVFCRSHLLMFETAFTSAPCAISSFTISGCCSCDGPHQRGLSVPVFPRVHLRAVSQQNLGGFDVAGARGGHQRRFAFGATWRWHRRRPSAVSRSWPRLPLTAGQIQRRDAIAVRGLRHWRRRRSAYRPSPDRSRARPSAAPWCRRLPGHSRRLLLQQRCDGGLVAVLHRFASRAGAATLTRTK